MYFPHNLNLSMKTHKYLDPNLTIEERVEDLLSKMTIEEKLAQMNSIWAGAKEFFSEDGTFDSEKCAEIIPNGIGQFGRIFHGLSAQKSAQKYNEIQRYFVEKTRLGIPAIFHNECLHGVMEFDAISFPHPIALAGSFNLDLAKKMYSFSAKDARARGICQVATPVLDVARDPRWGRVEETYGEDPYLIAEMGKVAVQGFQGDTSKKLANDKVIATVKHFAAHGQPENGTNCAPANYSARIISEVCLYHFKRVIQEANPVSVMPSYNEIDGVPSHANKWLLQDVLRNEYNFKGFVFSDYYAVEQLEQRHKVAATKKEAAKLAVEAGVDMETPEPNIYKYLPELIEEGSVDISVIDAAVRKLLYYKFFAGIFDNPYISEDVSMCASSEGVNLSEQIAAESICLLKNNGILPLQKTKQKIAVIGPNADYHSIGGYACPNKNFITILNGLKDFAKNSDVEIEYAKGCGITTDAGSWFEDEVVKTNIEDDKKLINEAVALAKTSDVIVLCIGGNEQTSREAWVEHHLGDRADLQMVGLQDELFEKLHTLGKPIVVVLSHGKPLAICNVAEKADAILDGWYLGQQTGNVVAKTIFGENNPSAKLAISVPRSVGHLPAYYNYKPTARRGYLFDDISPLFPFGYGLSYTKFALSNINVKVNSISDEKICKVSLNVKNIGNFAGAEVIQIYIRDTASSVTRPVKELKAFQKVFLEKGETQTVEISLNKDAFAFYDINMNYVIEPGEFNIFVGTSSQDSDLELKRIKL